MFEPKATASHLDSHMKQPIRDVRVPVANGGRPDVALTAQFGRD